jgi:hypothetical protein
MRGTPVAQVSVMTGESNTRAPGAERRERESGITYILPIRATSAQATTELASYIRWVAERAEIIVVDGSPPDVFARHRDAWGAIATHVAPDPALRTPMGKVGGVLTGVQLASHEHLVIADDDVRYDDATLTRVAAALDVAHVVQRRRTTSTQCRGTPGGIPAARC